MKVFLKDSAINGLNPHHFETHGRIYEVAMIDYESEEVSVRTPSMLEFKINEVKILESTGMPDSTGKPIHEDDILESQGKKFAVYWEYGILTWRVKSIEPSDKTYYCYNLSSLMRNTDLKIVGNLNEPERSNQPS